jgi:CheY-like chemotaxis protein
MGFPAPMGRPNSVEAIRQAIVAATEQIRPLAETPPTARTWRIYDLLVSRYVQELTQKETAQRLGITSRHLRREQQQAIHVLAQRLWMKRQHSDGALQAATPPAMNAEPAAPASHTITVGASPRGRPPEDTSTAWHDQLYQELGALRRQAPGMVADVERVLQGVRELAGALLASPGLKLEVGAVAKDLAVPIHPNVLRQLLITAVEKLAHVMNAGSIRLQVEQHSGRVFFCTTGSPVAYGASIESEFVRAVMAEHGGAVHIEQRADALVMELDLPVIQKATVLVIDDNTDLVHFYRRYTEGTRYQIIHVREGRHVFATIAQTRPQVIVLDVMLPDVDGWQLLIKLHEDPAMQAIPIVVCSVVRREGLARTLGAAQSLVKPVGRQDFINALEQALAAESP